MSEKPESIRDWPSATAREIMDVRILAARNRRARENRKAREDALKSIGLRKVRGALGGVYWE